MLKILLLLVILLHSNYLFSQSNLKFTHYTTRDGLSNNIIRSLFQDSRGLLWVGTSNGLNFFDGVSFQNVFPTDYDPVHLHSDQVNEIGENSDGNILLMTDDGLEEYNWKTKSFQLIFSKSMNGGINQFIVDRKKNIWVLCKKYLQQYNQQFKLLNNIELDTLESKSERKSSSYGSFSYIDDDNNIWFHDYDLVCEWNTTTHILENKFNNVHNRKIFEVNTASISEDSSKNFWYCSDMLYCYHSVSNSLSIYKPPNDLQSILMVSRSGKIWLNTILTGLIFLIRQKKHSKYFGMILRISILRSKIFLLKFMKTKTIIFGLHRIMV